MPGMGNCLVLLQLCPQMTKQECQVHGHRVQRGNCFQGFPLNLRRGTTIKIHVSAPFFSFMYDCMTFVLVMGGPCTNIVVSCIGSCLSTVIVPPKVLLQRPKAGSSLSFCPLEKKMSNSWSPIEPSTFRVRGQNYLRWEQSLFICIMFLISLNCFILLSFSFACNVLHYSFLHLSLSIKSTFHLFYRDKKKDFAPNFAAYCPFAADVFLSQRKIDHIARFVDLPVIDSSEELPSILVVNLQVFLLFSFFLSFYFLSKCCCFLLSYKFLIDINVSIALTSNIFPVWVHKKLCSLLVERDCKLTKFATDWKLVMHLCWL